MAEFIEFKSALRQQMDIMAEGELFRVDVEKEALWDTYIESFPEGTNPIFRERREFDCQCCKQFIRAGGGIVSVVDNQLVSIWDIEVGGHFQVVADALSKLVKAQAIRDVLLHPEQHLGTDHNHQLSESGDTIQWSHFHYLLPQKFVKRGVDIGTALSQSRSGKDVFKRGLDEITIRAVETVIELIEQNSLYRGEEHVSVVKLFLKHKSEYMELAEEHKDNYCWVNSVTLGGAARVRNSAIGTLLVDLSEEMELDAAVRKFEAMVAPTNYKRPTALITKSMIDNAQKKVEELGISESLQRRYAVTEDVTINNVLFADRSVKKAMNVFDELAEEVPDNISKLDKVEEVDVNTFIDNILPKADSIDLMMENRNTNNLMSLIAPVNSDSKNILKWDNNFSWAYNGEVADSMKERVKAAGGRVDGVLRFTHSWNHNRGNSSLMDLHVFMPTCSYKESTGKEVHDKYPNGQRVGWNNRTDARSNGVQDVDFVEEAPVDFVPVENITFPSVAKMPEGKYYLKIHNWNKRSRNAEGFRAEIEFEGNLYEYTYEKPLAHKEWVDVAVVTLKDGKFSIEHKLPCGSQSKEVWGINTQKFRKVSMVMNSPNHWDGRTTGNKHLFFILDGCKNDQKSRGFFNEFLKEDLTEHRKVFEVLGSKMKTEESDSQLSGLGFSSTQRNHVLCRVSGSFNRVVKINF